MSHLILLHGFTQTGRSWAPLIPSFEASGCEVDAPDIPIATDLWAAARAIGGQCGTGTWLGYSMGGRLALHVAIHRPEVVERLVLVGATAGIEDPVDRAIRREIDDGWGALVERIGVEAFLDVWLAQPLFAGLDKSAAGREARMDNTPQTLAAHVRALGTGRQESLWPRLHELEMPVLLVAGALDGKFIALGRRMADAIGDNAALALVPGAGHACHLEQPRAFLDVVLPFVAGAGHSAMPAASKAP